MPIWPESWFLVHWLRPLVSSLRGLEREPIYFSWFGNVPFSLPFSFLTRDDWISLWSQLISLFHRAPSDSLIEPIPTGHCITFSSERLAFDFRIPEGKCLASRTLRNLSEMNRGTFKSSETKTSQQEWAMETFESKICLSVTIKLWEQFNHQISLILVLAMLSRTLQHGNRVEKNCICYHGKGGGVYGRTTERNVDLFNLCAIRKESIKHPLGVNGLTFEIKNVCSRHLQMHC
jgi:hypothetical protein